MLFLIMCCCGNIFAACHSGQIGVYAVGGLAQLTLAPGFIYFFTISFSLFVFLLCYFIEDKSFALCTCQEQGNCALLLQCAFTRETTQTHKTLRVNEHSEATDWRGRTYHMGTWKSAQLKPILTRVGEVGNCIHFENVS